MGLTHGRQRGARRSARPHADPTPTPGISSADGARRLGPDAALAAVLALVVAAFSLTGNLGSEFWWPDAARHAMDGAFVLDFVRDLPASLNAWQYAIEYYARYPCLGLVQYPPVFAAVEGAMFALFGVSLTVARLTVAVFGAVGAVFGYKLARRFVGRLVAVVFVLITFGAPAVVWWSREVMLEVPVIAMMLVASHYFVAYVETQRRRDCIVAGALLAVAVLTKQTACVVGPVWAAYAIWRRGWRVALRWEVLVAVGALAVVLGPFAFATVSYAKVNIGQSIGKLSGGMAHSRSSWRAVGFYPTRAPQQAGWLALGLVGLCAVGVAGGWALRRPFLRSAEARRAAVLGVVWAAVCWAVFTFAIAHKDSRFIIVWMPGLALVAAAGVDGLLGMGRLGRVLAWVAVAACVARTGGQLTGVSQHWGHAPTPHLRGPGAAAAKLAAVPRWTVIFYSGYDNGNFIFAMRCLDPDRRAVVLRGTKMLVTMATEKEHGMHVLARTQDDIAATFRRYGVRYVVLEEPSPKLLKIAPVFGELTALVHTSKFRCIADVATDTNLRARARRLSIYEVTDPRPAQAKELGIELLSAGRTIRVPLERLGVRTLAATARTQ